MDQERIEEPDLLEAPVEPLEGPAERREEEEPVDVAPAARPPQQALPAETPRTAKLRKTEPHLESERELRESSVEKGGLETRCLVARTALVIPLSTPEEEDGPICLSAAQTRQRVESYLERRVINADGELTPMWRVQELPREVHDLSPHFRQLLGFVNHRESRAPRLRSWRTYRLKLRKEIRTTLFADAVLWSFDLEGSPVKYACRISSVELIVFPLGTPIFSLKIDWLPTDATQLTLAQVRTRLYVSKFRAKVARVNSGWTFTPHVSGARTIAAQQSHTGSLGAALTGALYGGEPISLGEFADALCAPHRNALDEAGSSKPRERHCYHHSIVCLASPLPDEALYSSLFHLRRAYGQKNRPPPPPSRHSLGSYDRVLIPRGNRYIGLSREGSVCLTWLGGKSPQFSESSQVFETQIWPHKWMGIYFVLGIHALGERESLEEISFLTALEADDISLTPDEAALSQTKEARYRLRSLAAVLIRFTLSMSSSDCGGLSEYSEYFRSLRDCFGIAERRAELDDEISHVQGMVDAYYMQEKRREEARRTEAREISQRYADKLQRLDDRYRQRVDLIVALLTSLALPLAVASSMWGMNNTDLPDIPWWSVIAGALILSAVLFMGISAMLVRRRIAYERYSSRLKKKLKQKVDETVLEEESLSAPSQRDSRRASIFAVPQHSPPHQALYVDPTAAA